MITFFAMGGATLPAVAGAGPPPQIFRAVDGAADVVRIIGLVRIEVLSWNLFHGRDHPPDVGLSTWRSRLLRRTERGPSHAQVNRDLREQFTTLLASANWDVALLQECPPRWAEHLATACGADAHLAPTARNLPFPLSRLQAAVASLNPDLIASWEGGCNLTLARPIAGAPTPVVTERRSLRIAGRPERRSMAFTRLSAGLCVANLHASTAREAAERELLEAAQVAIRWSDGEPLLLGGDLNIRPAGSAQTFALLAARFGLTGPTGGDRSDAIDHLLAGPGLATLELPRQWDPERRELPDPTTPSGEGALPIRLSDHAPVSATFELA